MGIPTFNAFNNCLILSRWETTPAKELKSIFGFEFQTKDGEVFEYIVDKLHFKDLIEQTLNRETHGETDVKYLEHLKKAMEGTTTKITIKIELEKYE